MAVRALPPLNTIAQADALDFARSLPDASVDCCLSSPPYFLLRNYGVDGQWGSEATLQAYLCRLWDLYGEIRRVLKPTGTCFVNLGDTYMNDPGGQNGGANNTLDYGKGNGRISAKIVEANRQAGRQDRRGVAPVPRKSLMLIPERFAIGMVGQGWIARNRNAWVKPNHMPCSATDRFAQSWEHVWFFTKRERYWSDLDAVRVPHAAKSFTVHTSPHKGTGTESAGEKLNVWLAERGRHLNPLGVNPGDVWEIATQPFSDWGETVRRVRVPLDAIDDDTCCIPSPDCPEHGDRLSRASIPAGGVRAVEWLSRTAYSVGRRAPAPEVDSAPIDQNPAAGFGGGSWDLPLLSHADAATPHNSQSRRTAPDPATTLPCVPSGEMPARIGDTSTRSAGFESGAHSQESKSSEGGSAARPSVQIRSRSADTPSCTCSYYREYTEKTSHFAVWPEELARRIIRFGCPPGGVAYDPFMGSGTTALVALQEGRDFLGSELNGSYIAIAHKRIRRETGWAKRVPLDLGADVADVADVEAVGGD